jgi:hypothetical protein
MKLRLALGFLAMMALVSATPVRAVDKDDINRAIDKGVDALRQLQQPGGTWPHQHIGATALAGLTLVECGAKEDDKAVQLAADAVRKASITLTHTYSIALSILFLDRLGEEDDVPLIESLMVRLLAGQDMTGGWTYDCPSISAAEVKRLRAKLGERKELAGRRELPKSRPKRTEKDLSPEIREQLRALERGQSLSPPGRAAPGGPPPGFPPGGPPPQRRPDDPRPDRVPPGVPPGGFPPPGPPGGGGPPGGIPFMGTPSDNSNTQFAALALWVGRRHGLPVEKAITKLDRRFRSTQMDDGGWSYNGLRPGPSMPMMAGMPGLGSTASMTCAGLLTLAIADGATLEYLKERKPDAKLPDISADKHLLKGLAALGGVIDNPKSLKPQLPPQARPSAPLPDAARRVGGRTYYFLWSMERVAVALALDTIGKKDWYGWGAEILLENQESNGFWLGEYGGCGADTCFALLFLKRANLARDLTAHIKGKAKDPGTRELRGGVGIDRRGRGKKMQSGIETKESKPIVKPIDVKPVNSESARLGDDLVKAKGSRQAALLEEMEKEKGVKYTEALASAIPKLEGEAHRKARQALANRLTRMKDETLQDYLQDDDAEIRRAAALAVGQKDSKTLVPNLIALLRDPETSVWRVAHASLKSLTGQDFGPDAKATRDDRDKAVLKWIDWYSKQRKKRSSE